VTVPPDVRSGTAWSVELAARPLDTSTTLAAATYIVNATVVNTAISLSAEPSAPEIGSLLRITAQVEPAEEETLQITVTGPDGSAQRREVRTGANGMAALDVTPDVSGPGRSPRFARPPPVCRRRGHLLSCPAAGPPVRWKGWI